MTGSRFSISKQPRNPMGFRSLHWNAGFSNRGSMFARARKAKPQLRPTPWRWGERGGGLNLRLSAGKSPGVFLGITERISLRDGLLPPKKISPEKRLVFFFWGGDTVLYSLWWYTYGTPLNRYVCRLSHEKDKVMNSRNILFVSGKSRLVTYYL